MEAIHYFCFLLFFSVFSLHYGHAKALEPERVLDDFGILGGKQIKITEAPFMALFRPKTYDWFCGAVIVHEQFLVSAGHCIDPNIQDTLRISVGTDNVTSGKDYEIEKAFVHPKYFLNSTMLDCDISVIKLKEKLTFDDTIKPIAIADSTLPKPGELLQAMGFGMTENNQASKLLLTVDLPYVDNESCQKSNTPDIVTNRMICAGAGDGKNVCHGDSGGPTVYKGKLIGINSWVWKGQCNAKGHPGVFAYVPSMTDFIDDVIKNNT